MIDFQPITLEDKKSYEARLMVGGERGCEYSFANLFLWGRQKAAVIHDHTVLFSQFSRRSIYPFPVGQGNKKPVLDAIIADAAQRGIPCRITGMGAEEKEILESLYPGKFRFHCDRDSFDYVYAVSDLADLKGKKYQRKRNHFNRFQQSFPHYIAEPLGESNLSAVRAMIDKWYADRQAENPHADYHMERTALSRALTHYAQLDMEGLVLRHGEDILAVTLGSRLSPDTFDIQFEKARWDVDGAYTVINCLFARHLREKYPQVQFLNREEDMGLEGLRKAKQSYYPHHMVEKCWACLLEDGYDY